MPLHSIIISGSPVWRSPQIGTVDRKVSNNEAEDEDQRKRKTKTKTKNKDEDRPHRTSMTSCAQWPMFVVRARLYKCKSGPNT